jgi:hypothetical protein
VGSHGACSNRRPCRCLCRTDLISILFKEKSMPVHNHAVVVDHRVAKVFYLGLEAVDERTIHANLATPHLHHKANTIGSGKV